MSDETSRSWRLSVTERCSREDLGIGADWHDALGSNPVLDAFVQRRSQLPEGQERIANLVGEIAAPVFSLHVGRDRAATWYDEEEEVVWLLAVASEHDYDHFRRLATADRLLPTVDDYEALDAPTPTADLVERIGQHARRLLAEAVRASGSIVEDELPGGIPVRICIEPGDPELLTVAVSERVAPGDARLPKQWQLAVLTAFFPGTRFEDLVPFALRIDGTDIRSDELGVTYFLPDVI
jgi:hypothetical protein